MNTEELLSAVFADVEAGRAPWGDALPVLSRLYGEDPKAARAWSRRMRAAALARATRPDGRPAELVEAMDAWEAMLLAAATDEFEAYVLYTELDREPSKRFYMPRMRQLRPAVEALQDLADGKLDFLSISMPPRVGKALAFGTPVLTRGKGWKPHGWLVPGDEVLAPDGGYRRVLAVHDPCEMEWEVEFTNGERVVCHGAHEWPVLDLLDGSERLVETREMAGAAAYLPEPGLPLRFMLQGATREPVYVAALRRCAPGTMGNCITVEGGLYCCGRSLLPTHNSTLCIFYLTWVMGRHPDRANVMTGYSDKLTSGFYEEAKSLITGEEYRFSRVFPDAPLVDCSSIDESIALGRASRYPTLTCRSVEGTLTGAVEIGPDALLYMDDLVSDREEALNSARMDKLYSIYNNQLKDRMKEGARQLCVATRWVPNDPIGRIEALHAGDPRYRFLAIPALDEDGESQFEYDFGLGFSTAYYEDMRRSLTDSGEEDSWAAKYMQRPYEREGRLFEPGTLRTFEELPEGEPDAVFAACDTKDKGADYCVMVVCAVYGADHYVVDVVCDNGAPETVEPRLARCLAANRVGLARFESNGAGGRVADDVQAQCLRLGREVEVRKKFSTANKETRILADSPWVKARCLFRAEPDTRDYRIFMQFLTSYSVVGRNAHDDVPDCMSMYKRMMEEARVAKVEAVERRF